MKLITTIGVTIFHRHCRVLVFMLPNAGNVTAVVFSPALNAMPHA